MPKPSFVLALLLAWAVSLFPNALSALENPKVRWAFKTQGPIRGEAAIEADRAYFGSADGGVYALDRHDGALVWRFATDGAIVGGLGISEDLVIAASRDNRVYAIAKDSGKLVWSFQMQDQLPALFAGWEYFTPAPVIDGDAALVASSDGRLYALELASGALQWSFDTGHRLRAAPLVADGTIYQASNDGIVYALSRENGAPSWRFRTAGAEMDSTQFGFDRNSIYDQPELHEKLLIFGARDGNVYAVDTETQTEAWRFGYDTTWAMTSRVSDGAVFVGWSTNRITCALDAATGEERWQYKCGAHIYATPLPLDDSVYVGSADGQLYRLDRNTGEKIWTYPIGSEIYSSPLHREGVLYFGADDGYFYAVEDGAEPIAAVYEPDPLPSKTGFALVDAQITPFLVERGFQRLASEQALATFFEERVRDGRPSVVVLAFGNLPDSVLGDDPADSLMRRYLEAGGKALSLGNLPNLHSFDSNGNYRRDPSIAARLLDVEFPNYSESGTYFCQATQDGLNWGLPVWLKATNPTVESADVTPLALDEFGRTSIWIKRFHDRPGSGFLSCRTWSYDVPMKPRDLELIQHLALHRLE